MFRKSVLIALAATATLGAASFASTSANAYVHGSGFRGHPGGFVHPLPRRPWYGHHHHWRRPVVWYAPRPVYAAAPVAAVAPVAAPARNNCSCLTKEYTPEGAVLFKDTCTNEMAMNPPDQQQQTGMQQQQQPQAQAYVPQYPPQTAR